MATTANQRPVKSSSAATGEKPSFLLFGGLALIGLLKDTLDLIGIGSLPVLGTGITLCFSFFSFMLLLLFDRSGGRGNKRLAQGMVVTFGTLVEGIGFVINFLPLQTLTAVFLYLISYKSWKNSQRAAAVVTSRQRSKLQTQQARMARAVALREERMRQQAANDSVASPEPAQERLARAPQMAGFPAPGSTGQQTSLAAPVVAAAAFSAARAGASSMTDARGGSFSRPADQSASGQLQSVRGEVVRSVGSISNPQSVGAAHSAPESLPILKTEHGYAVDIGKGEVFGEYRTADEARRAVPEAIRSRDARQAYLRNQGASNARPASAGMASAAVAATTPSLRVPNVVLRGVGGIPKENQSATPSRAISPSSPVRLETFDARRELAGLKAIPKTERREKLAEIKQKLSRQTEGLAQVQTNIFSAIRKNPDASYDDLHSAMIQQGAAYGMNDRQREIGDDVLKKYVAKHEQIRGLRNQYSDDRELFKAFFGRPPKGDVTVVDGPMSFYFKCQDVNDFALIRSQSFIEGREPTAGEVAEAAHYGGLAGVSTLIPGINGSVMAENSSHEVFQKSPDQSDTVRTHEEQHVMNHLFAEQFDESRDVIGRFHEANTQGEKEVAVEDYLRYFQQKAEEESRDEILAYFKDGRSLDEILTTLALKKDEGGGYDFLVEDRTMGEYNVAVLFGEEFQSFARSKAKKMYDTEYRDHLKTALQSVERLTKAGYDRDKAIALLVHEPLSRWDKVTGRLLATSTTTNGVAPQTVAPVTPELGQVANSARSQSPASSKRPNLTVVSPPAAASPAPARTAFTKLKDLSTDASTRIREAGSRLSQTVRPKVNAGTTTKTPGQSVQTPAPQSVTAIPVPSKEQLFEARIAARMRNPNQPLDDSKATEQLFQKTPEYAVLSQRGKQISTATAYINEIDAALRSYLSVKDSQRGMHGSGEYMATGNQQVRVDAATRLHELSKKYEAMFPYLKRYTEWKNINLSNVARSLEIHQDTVGQYRREKELFDREVSAARFKFNQGLANDYQTWLNQRKGQKHAA